MKMLFFVRGADLLKATHYKTITVPGHVHHGVWVDTYTKNALVSDDHDHEKVAAGQGSFYQKEAHKKALASVGGFHAMPVDHKAAIVLHLATDLQTAASASAAVSGFKASMLAGKVPTPAQYQAMLDAHSNVQGKLADAIATKIGQDNYEHLIAQASANAKAKATKVVAPAAAVAPVAVAEVDKPAAPVDKPAVSDHVAALVKIGQDKAQKQAELVAAVEKMGLCVQKTHHGLLVAPNKGGMATAFATEDEALDHCVKLHHIGLNASFVGKKPFFVKVHGLVPGGKPAAVEAPPAVKKIPLIISKPVPAAAPVAPVPVFPESPEVLQQLQAIPWFKQKLPPENTNAKSHNAAVTKIEAMAFAGDKVGLQAFVDAKASAKQTYAKKQGKLAHDALAALNSGGGSALGAAPQATATPVVTADTPLQPAQKEALDKLSPGELQGIADMPELPANVQAYVAAKIADGPRDGDTKTGADGNNLVFKKGRWHKYVDADQSGELPPVLVPVEGAPAAPSLEGLTAIEASILKDAINAGAADTLLTLSKNALNPALKAAASHALVMMNALGSKPNANLPSVAPVEPESAPLVKQKVGANYFTNNTGGSNKFWSVSLSPDGKSMMTQFGKIGTLGQVSVKEFDSPIAAATALYKLTSQKEDKGYEIQKPVTHEWSVPAAGAAPATAPIVASPPAPAAIKKLNDLQISLAIQSAVSGSFGFLKNKPANAAIAAAKKGNSFEISQAWSDAVSQELLATAKKIKAVAQAMGVDVGGWDSGADAVAAPAGPKDGDTKQGADGMLVLKDGRWVKVATPAKAAKPSKADMATEAVLAVQVPDFSLDGHKNANYYDPLCKKIKDAALKDGLAGVKNLVTFHAGGTSVSSKPSAAGFKTAKCFANGQNLRQKMFFEFCTQLKAALESQGKTIKPATAGPGAQANAPAAAAAPSVQAPVIPLIVPSSGGVPVTNMDAWVQTGEKKGSNPGGTFKDNNGQEWYCKFPATEDHCKNELLASKLYKVAGVAGPQLKLVKKDGKMGIASMIVPGVSKVGAGIKGHEGAVEGFAVDAWLANHDAVGTGYDNLLKTPDGKAIRIDVGGALLYRAMGEAKGDVFGDKVGEMQSMVSPSKSQYGAAVFGDMTKAQIDASVALVLDVSDEAIKSLVTKFGPGSAGDKAALTAKLIARKNDLKAKYPGADLLVNPPLPDPTKLKVSPENLPPLPSFKGLSKVEAVNVANEKAAAEIYESALKGDFVAIKKLKYHVVDKATGKVAEGGAFEEHPSSHIKAFYSAVIDHMSALANPIVKKAKDWATELFSDLSELSDVFQAHLYGVSVGKVPANQRLGFWISLGQAEAAAQFVPPDVHFVSAADSKKGQASVKSIPAELRSWMKSVKASGAANQSYRDGAEIDSGGRNARTVLSQAYANAVSFSAGTRISKGISLPPAMMAQMQALAPGHVFQNPGSMCCSLNKNWSWSGDATLTIIYAEGAKALYNIGVGSHDGEGEVTTIPGQRFMFVEKKANAKYGTEFVLLMLPPDENYIANIKPPK